MAHGAYGVLRAAQKSKRPIAAVVAVEGIVGFGDGGDEFLRVAQQVAASGKLLLLAGAQLRPLQLVDLVGQGVHPAGFFRFIHFQRLYFALYICKGIILFAVCTDKRFQISEAVQKHEVLLLVQQLLAVMLAVDVQQAAAQRLQLSHRHGTAVYPAGALAVAADLALQQQRAVLLRRNAQLLRSGVDPGEHGADKRLVRAGADQLAAGALAQHGAEGIDNDGFARARFAGQGVEARLKPDVRLLDDGDILNMEHFQHGVALPRLLSGASV